MQLEKIMNATGFFKFRPAAARHRVAQHVDHVLCYTVPRSNGSTSGLFQGKKVHDIVKGLHPLHKKNYNIFAVQIFLNPSILFIYPHLVIMVVIFL
jgi:hypothetical protein